MLCFLALFYFGLVVLGGIGRHDAEMTAGPPVLGSLGR
jgi:hypothetical protein